MATNLALDDKLINKAKRVGRHKTKKDAVTAALEEYVRRREQLAILDLAGTIDYYPDYDYKRSRGSANSPDGPGRHLDLVLGAAPPAFGLEPARETYRSGVVGIGAAGRGEAAGPDPAGDPFRPAGCRAVHLPAGTARRLSRCSDRSRGLRSGRQVLQPLPWARRSRFTHRHVDLRCQPSLSLAGLCGGR